MVYVTNLINHVMKSQAWPHTAIFLCWDDWGGFYDHAPPPKLDEYGYGDRYFTGSTICSGIQSESKPSSSALRAIDARLVGEV